MREPGDERLAEPHADERGDCHASFTLGSGQLRGLVMDTSSAGPPRAIRVAEAQRMLDETRRFWRAWLSQSTYTGRWREALERSAITLKLMTYAPSGGLVAAPTAGLPEQVGGERNWDYRYTWVRDASFSVHALLRMGFVEEAAAFGRWLADRVEEKAGGASGPLNIMYRVDGSSDLFEETLEHWEGYRGSRPVRIGNGAADQLQLDIYGEAMDSIYFGDQAGLVIGHEGWAALRDTIDWLADQLGPAGGGYLGDPWRPERLHLRAGHVLERLRSCDPTRHQAGPPCATRSVGGRPGRGLRPGRGARLGCRTWCVRAALRRQGP